MRGLGKKFATFVALLFSAILFAGVFFACGEEEKGGSFTPPTDEEPYVTELIVTQEPIKKEYKVGQLFDPTGMKLVAKWSHGVDEDLSPGECRRTPTGALEAGTTEITFTYEGASCTQPISVETVAITDVAFDFSAIGAVQLLGVIDLTAISVQATYEDGSTEEVTSAQYEMFENDVKIVNPVAYTVTQGSHTVTVRFGSYAQSFSFAALYGYDVPLTLVKDDASMQVQINAKNSFLEKPASGGTYEYNGTNLYEVIQGSVMRFHVYSEFETQAELIMNLASNRLIEGSWSDPKKMGEVQFNKAFDVNSIAVDPATGLPELQNGEEIKTSVPMEDSVILPGAISRTGDVKILENYVDVSFGEIALNVGYNIIEVAVKDCEEYKDHEGKVRTANIKGFSVRALNSDVHEHALVVRNGSASTCSKYGEETYYRCTVCARIFKDENGENRIFNPLLISPDPDAHTWNREHADCTHEKYCVECGLPGESKTPHTFERDLCTSDEGLECTVCHQFFSGGHQAAEENGRFVCGLCGKVLSYKVQAEDGERVRYLKADGTALTPGSWQKDTDGSNGGKLFNGADGGISAGNMEGNDWIDATMEVKVNVDEDGIYLFKIRCNTNQWPSEANGTMDLASVYSYCVNPGDGERAYTPVTGTVHAVTDVGDYKNMYLWGINILGEIELHAGENTVVVKIATNRGPHVDYFEFEKKGQLSHSDAEVITTRTNGNIFGMGATAVEQNLIVPGLYIRLAVPADMASEVGYAYDDVPVTREMYEAAGFDTSVAGEKTVTFTVEKYGRTYTATFDYIVQ